MLAHRPPPIHGAAIVGDLVYQELRLASLELKYIGLSTSSSISDNGKINFKKVYSFAKILKSLLLSIITYRPSIIYLTPSVNGISFYRDLLFLLLIKVYKYGFKNCRIIFHLHMRPVRQTWFKKKYLFNLFLNNIEVIFLSKKLIDDYSKDNLKNSVCHILPNTIKPLLNKELAIQKTMEYHSKIKIKNSKANILYLGHLMESKGYKRALDIAKSILGRCEDYNFLFVGEFNSSLDKEYFDDYVNSNDIKSNVEYLGPCTKDVDKINFLISSDILILPSYSEAYPLTILEAFSLGLPVVATDTGAIREIVRGDYGKIVSDDPVNENYIKSFSEAIIKQENKWNQNLAIKCIVNFHEKWSEKEFSKQLLKIFSIVR
tara:strand:+ start:194 stop:1318 length:1125 start_codon:yes stop_codon:yes gene_type:complete